MEVVGLDCEMVGVAKASGSKLTSALARISMVGISDEVILDCLVLPDEEVRDWRAAITGLSLEAFTRPGSVPGLPSLVMSTKEVLELVNAILDERVIVGHDLRHDLKLLRRHQQRSQLLRDTAFFPSLRPYDFKGGLPSLRSLAKLHLGVDIQTGIHDSIEDARTAMHLYLLFRDEFEEYITNKKGPMPKLVPRPLNQLLHVVKPCMKNRRCSRSTPVLRRTPHRLLRNEIKRRKMREKHLRKRKRP